MIERAKEYFLNHNLNNYDIPKAAIIHETIGLSLFFGIWIGCYFFKPTHKIIKPLYNRYPKLFDKIHKNKYDDYLKKAKEKLTKTNIKLGNKKLESERAVISLAESIFIRNFIRPITIPLKLWLTWKIILKFKTI